MDKNNLIMVVVILALAAAYFLNKSGSETAATQVENIDLLGVKDGSFNKLVITENKASLTIYNKDGIWVVKEKYDYPVDNQRVKEVLNNILKLKGDTFYTKDKTAHEQFELVDPTKKDAKGFGKKIELFSKEGTLLAGIILGKIKSKNQPGQMPYMASQSQYIRKVGDDAVYLSNNTLSVSAAPSNWLDKKVTDIKKNLIREISLQGKDIESYTLKRNDSKSDLTLSELKPGMKPVSYQIEAMLKNVEDLNMESILNIEDASKLEFLNTYTFKTFEGLIYTFKITKPLSEHNQQYCFQLEASIDTEYLGKSSPTNEDGKEVKKLTLEQASAIVNEFNGKHKNWRYLIANWIGKKFIKELSVLTEVIKVEKPNKEEPVSEEPIKKEPVQEETSKKIVPSTEKAINDKDVIPNSEKSSESSTNNTK